MVEGKDDVAAVKRALDAEVIATGGYGFDTGLIVILRAAVKRSGVIIFTDPDSAGNQIRRRLSEMVAGCKHAYLAQAEGKKGRDIGVENASPETIRQAIKAACTMEPGAAAGFSLADMVSFGLTGSTGACEKRKKVGILLGIGETNTKQFLQRLNHQGISPLQLLAAVEKIRGE